MLLSTKFQGLTIDQFPHQTCLNLWSYHITLYKHIFRNCNLFRYVHSTKLSITKTSGKLGQNHTAKALGIVWRDKRITTISVPGSTKSRNRSFAHLWLSFCSSCPSKRSLVPSRYWFRPSFVLVLVINNYFAEVEVNSGGYLTSRFGEVNIHRYSPTLRRINVLVYTTQV